MGELSKNTFIAPTDRQVGRCFAPPCLDLKFMDTKFATEYCDMSGEFIPPPRLALAYEGISSASSLLRPPRRPYGEPHQAFNPRSGAILEFNDVLLRVFCTNDRNDMFIRETFNQIMRGNKSLVGERFRFAGEVLHFYLLFPPEHMQQLKSILGNESLEIPVDIGIDKNGPYMRPVISIAGNKKPPPIVEQLLLEQ